MASVKDPAGYSGTPLLTKLGIKASARVQIVNSPANFAKTLGKLPGVVTPASRGTLDFAMLFVTRKSELSRRFPRLRDRLASDGMLWVSWPKQSSGAPTDLTENIVRTVGLELGLVDVKVCAVDSIWSGLKFVKRLIDR
ncbi:MAG TPA: DUF3052 domain-containing protein [Gemmatimonadaceae bacterium]|nr:DUF3052 domain-containing protein [Gemmatimonadaceae bacterium]